MIILIISIFAFIFCICTYIYGYKSGFIDGRLNEKWRMRDECKVKNIARNSTDS